MWRSIISFGLLLCCYVCEWSNNYQIALSENITTFDYSVDSQYIWAINLKQVYVLQSRRGSVLWKYSFNDRNLSTAGFNSNSSYLAVASQDGQVSVFHRNGRDFQFFASYNDSSHSTEIKSLCFSIDGHSIVLGFYNNLIVVWSIESKAHVSKSFQNLYVHSVACSPTSANNFIVSGGNKTVGSLIFYQFNMTSKVITIENKATQKKNVSTSCVFSSDGKKVYRVGNDGFIYVYDSNWSQTALKVNKIDKQMLKIRVSQNERVIALLLPKQVAILNPSTNQSIIQTIDVSTNEMALSNQNPHLVLFKKNQAWILGQCLLKQFVNDQNGECQSCDGACLYCQQNATNCYFCESGAYLQKRKCLLCESKVKYCKECEEGGKCTVCDFALDRDLTQQGVCDCKLGFYQKNAICQSCKVYGCSKCVNDTYCTECFESYYLNETHQCACKIGYLDSLQEKCLNCTEGCITCGSHDDCYTCYQDYYLYDQECLKNGVHLGIVGGILAGSIAIPILVYFGVRIIKKRKSSEIEEEYQNLQ